MNPADRFDAVILALRARELEGYKQAHYGMQHPYRGTAPAPVNKMVNMGLGPAMSGAGGNTHVTGNVNALKQQSAAGHMQ